MPTLLILTASILAQFAAAGLALHSWKLSRWQFGWGLLGLAFLLMGVRRTISFYRLSTAETLPQDFNPAELVALAISILMVAGVLAVRKLIADMEKAKQAISDMSARFETAQYIANVGSWEWDIQTGALWWSDEIYRIFGLTPKAFPATYEAFLNAVHKDDRDAVQQAVTSSIETHNIYSIEHRVIWPDGTIRIVHEQGHATYANDGTPLRMNGTVQDITERKEADHQIQKLNQELEQRVEARTAEAVAERKKAEHYLAIAGTMIIALDTQGHVSLINQKGSDILGWAPEEIIGRCWFHTAIPEDVRDNVQGIFARIMAGDVDAIEHYENEVVTSTGKRRTISWHNTLIRDADGTITGSLSAGDDITERKAMEAQLVQSSKMATLGEMATAMAHEINQPMNVTVMTVANIRKKSARGECDHEYLEDKLKRIDDQTQRATAIINHLRIFGRNSESEMRPVPVRMVVSGALGLIGEQLRLAQIQVETDFEDGDVTVVGDQVRFEQVFLNLIGNARDAIQQHGGKGKIHIRVGRAREDGLVRITVHDTGGGIPADVMVRVFDPFFTTKEVGKGTGIGLSISFGIIEEMKGKIGVQNRDGGAEFEILLPAGKKDADSAVA